MEHLKYSFKLKNNQQGSGHLILLVLFVVIAIGATGYFVYQRMNDNNPLANNASNMSDTSNGSILKTQIFKSSNSSIKYPSSWTVKDSTKDICSTNINGECSEFVEIMSGDGLIVRYVEQPSGLVDISGCEQAICTKQTVTKIFPTDNEGDIYVAVVENKMNINNNSESAEISASLHKPTSEDRRLQAGQHFGITDKKQIWTGVSYKNYHFNLFLTYDYINGMAENIPAKYAASNTDEFMKIDKVKEAIEILKSFEFAN